MPSNFRLQLENWLKTIDVITDRVADIGGGALPVYHRVRSWNVKDYVIVDNEQEEQKEKPKVVADLNDEGYYFHRRDGLSMETFDVVFCLEVMEYVWDIRHAIDNIFFLLKSGGIAYLSFPFLYPVHRPSGMDYLRFTKFGVERLLKEAGFEEFEIIPRKMTKEALVKWREFISLEGMHADKEFDGYDDIGYLVKAVKP
jgi:SAM-dependent methyltransferase